MLDTLEIREGRCVTSVRNRMRASRYRLTDDVSGGADSGRCPMAESSTPSPGHVPASGDATSSAPSDSLIAQLRRAFDAVDTLVTNIRPDQWSMPTPCTDWTVRRLVDHLVGMNLVFTALLEDQLPPQRRQFSANAENRDNDRDGDRHDDPVGAFRTSAANIVIGDSGTEPTHDRGPLRG